MVVDPDSVRCWYRRDHGMGCTALVQRERLSAYAVSHAVRLTGLMFPPSPDSPVFRTSTTIIAPTPLIAANFMILGQIMNRMGQSYSRLSARTCALSRLPRPLLKLVTDVAILDALVFLSCVRSGFMCHHPGQRL